MITPTGAWTLRDSEQSSAVALMMLLSMFNEPDESAAVEGKLPIEILSTVKCRGASLPDQISDNLSGMGLFDTHAALISTILNESEIPGASRPIRRALLTLLVQYKINRIEPRGT